jgi:pantoate--beta-alanine ligase
MMHVISTVRAFQEFCRNARRPLGLVATMGALHDGHLSLVRQGRVECATVAASIFVNPKQFAPREDLGRYPRPLERDLELLSKGQVDVVFVPPVEEVYPVGFSTLVHVGGPAMRWENEIRPGHFDGVATVVTKLLLMAGPDIAYFGQKDGQQVAVVKRLVTDLHIPAQIRVMPTVREPDGLAMSSRNAYLSPAERQAAPVVYQALRAAEALYRQHERRGPALEKACGDVLASEPLVSQIDYVALVAPDTFEPVALGSERPAMLAVAVRIGSIRLIDNVILGG